MDFDDKKKKEKETEQLTGQQEQEDYDEDEAFYHEIKGSQNMSDGNESGENPAQD